MLQLTLNFLRPALLSAAALGLAVLMPLAIAQIPARTAEPRQGEAHPRATSADEAHLAMAPGGDHLTDAQTQDAPLHDAHLQGGLAEPDGPYADIADLYAPAPEVEGAVSLFHRADLGLFASRAAAQARWAELADRPALLGLRPAYDGAGADIRLSAGPLTSASAVDALCVELSALGDVCRPVAPSRAW